MALSGTLKDFGLPDIFQLIGLQRKTGALTLQSDREVVNVLFETGKVVHADSTVHRLDDLLGNVLVRQGRLTNEKLKQALARQKVSMQRLGFILTNQGFIDAKDLGPALAEQVQQIVFRVFRWKTGTYHFEPAESVDYDREHASPVSTDQILMEGIRQVDEWPIIEKRISSMSMVFKGLVPIDQISTVDTDAEGVFEGLDTGGGKGSASEVSLSLSEAKIYRLLDGHNSVTDVVAKTGSSDFDVCRTLFDLVDRNLISSTEPQQKATRARTAPSEASESGVNRIGWAVVGVLSLFGLVLSITAPFRVPFRTSILSAESFYLEGSEDAARLNRVVGALRTYHFAFGDYPSDLGELTRVDPPLLRESDLEDSSGDAFLYRLEGSRALLQAVDAAGRPYLDTPLPSPRRDSSLNQSGSVGSSVR